MTTAETKKPFHNLEIEIVEGRLQHLSFTKADDLRQWLRDERDFWSRLAPHVREFTTRLNANYQPYQMQNDFFSPDAAILDKSSKNDDGLKAFADKFVKHVADGTLLGSWQPKYRPLRILAQTDGLAAGLAGSLIDPPPNSSANWANFHNIVQNVSASSVARAFVATMPIDLESIAGGAGSQVLFNRLMEQSTALSGYETELVERLEGLEQLEKDLQTKLATEAPVSYWTAKASEHKVGANKSFVAFIGVAIAIIALMALLGPMGYHHFVSVARGICEAGDTACQQVNIGFAPIIALTLPALIGFWILKLIARQYVQHVQRRGDALERVAMVRTYLSLAGNTTARPNEAERLLIMQALFRPGPGDTPETAPQEAIFEFLSNVKGRG